MERIGRNRFLNAENRLRNHEMKSLLSGNQLYHFERYLGLDIMFSS